MSTARAGCEDPDAGASDRSTRLIMLQRAAGNRAVGTLISSLAQPGPTSTIQNLAISRCGGKPCACDEEPISNQEAATGRLIQREEVDPADIETAPISLPPKSEDDSTSKADCPRLLQEIRDLIDGGGKVAKGLVCRLKDLLEDKHDLFNRFKDTPGPGRRGSWDGHVKAFDNQQNALINRMNDYILKRCGDPPGVPLPDDAVEWGKKPTPERPANLEAPTPAVAVPTPAPSRSKILTVLAVLGLSAALVVAVAAAVADPEPVTKLTAAGLSVRTATLLLAML